MYFFGNKLNILGLILLGVIVLTLVSSYKEGLQDSVNEKELTEGMINYSSQYPGQEKQILEYLKKILLV